MDYEVALSRWTTQVSVVVCCSLLFLVVVCWALLLFVVTGNVARALASIIPRRGCVIGTGTMAQVSSPDG